MILKNSIAFNFVLLTPASWLSTLQKSQTVCWKLEVAAFSSEALLQATTCTLAQFAHLLWGDIEFQANWQHYAAISSGWVDWWEFAAYQHLTRLVVDGFLFWSDHLLHAATSFLCSCCGVTMGFPRQVGRRKYFNVYLKYRSNFVSIGPCKYSFLCSCFQLCSNPLSLRAQLAWYIFLKLVKSKLELT